MNDTPKMCSVEGCAKPKVARGMCKYHWQNWSRHGEAVPANLKTRGHVPLILDEIIKHEGDECLAWPYGAIKGYGVVRIDGRNHLAHRVVCEKVNGPPPDPAYDAAHNCGNGHLGCVNPKHLRWATRKDNLSDMIRHGTIMRGEKQKNAKLTEKDVFEIRKLHNKKTQLQISKDFGVSLTLVNGVIHGNKWGWLQ